MKYVSFALLMMCSFGCIHQQQTNNKNARKDHQDSLKALIAGFWGGLEGEAGTKFTADTMYYLKEKEAYYYMVHDNSLVVLYKEGPFLMKDICIQGDTMIYLTMGKFPVRMFRVR